MTRPGRVKISDLDSLLHQPVWAMHDGRLTTGLLVNADVYPGRSGGRHVQINPTGNTHRRGPIVRATELRVGPPPEEAEASASATATVVPRKPKSRGRKQEQPAAPNLARLAEFTSMVVERINSAIVRSQLIEEIEASGRPEVLREVLNYADIFRMLAVDYTHVVAQAAAGVDARIAVALTDLVGDLGKAGGGFHEVSVDLVDMQRELDAHAEWPPRRASSRRTEADPVSPQAPDDLPSGAGDSSRHVAARRHIDTLSKVVAGHCGTVKIPPGVVADLFELAEAEPDGPTTLLAAVCKTWLTDDGGAHVPADELARALNDQQLGASDDGR